MQANRYIDDDADKITIPIHAFDIINADECHGAIPQKIQISGVRFSTIRRDKVGLTATPASHTVAYFGNPIYRYTVEQAVLDGFLVDYQAIKIKSDVRINGIFLKEGEKVGLKNPETGTELIDALEDEREFNSQDVERKITSPDSNRKILEEIKKYALEHESKTGRFPKTLVFAVNDIPHTSHSRSACQSRPLKYLAEAMILSKRLQAALLLTGRLKKSGVSETALFHQLS
jgi:type I restriction enzyme R subunit